ncbi:branched-chain amino acid aminotransferase/4-amino-4-deoxychorismate lyase [Halovivax ruber XH-70]|uniref:Branched-chain amino acid aminotransferase/4-amino-4-deoxychorismate lyase n=1 Tax=Halovivax ruber (strain DSM 18193 / JCM 13892 / XH-70) TaxID=797302 RepID=L0IDY6_HALRX|nr:aminotransferase class IV [Halovivax ruber]AGB17048.1 branched-chain amino acid aminotransferase/4-amino-4-deoxychorismate lyase [Halovivax ruber XH-70]
MTAPDNAESLLYHVDGELVPAEEATVSVDDRGFRYGDAAFETVRAYGGSIFEWDAHADRLARTCETLGIAHGFDREDLRARIDETLAANELADAYVRLSITRGVQPGTVTPQRPVDPTVVIWVKPLPRGGVDGQPVWAEPAVVRTVETRRIPDAALPSAAKTHNYANGILARLELRGTDADEALMLDGRGHVTEGATSNVFLVDDGELVTPSTDGPVLPGITRRVVLELAAELEIPAATRSVELQDVATADEVFLTNSTWELRPVCRFDGEAVGQNRGAGDERSALDDVAGSWPAGWSDTVEEPSRWPLTARLQRAFDERVDARYY